MLKKVVEKGNDIAKENTIIIVIFDHFFKNNVCQ